MNKEAINLKKSEKGVMGRFRGRKGEGKMI